MKKLKYSHFVENMHFEFWKFAQLILIVIGIIGCVISCTHVAINPSPGGVCTLAGGMVQNYTKS